MATNALKTTPLSSDAEQAINALEDARAGTLALVAHLDEEQLERVHSPIMSPLVWDLGHIAAYEDLWLAHRLAGMELLRPELAELYDAFETPRAVRGEIETLRPAEARAYLADVRERTSEAIARRGVGDGVVCEMVVRHELQHSETMRQTLAIAGLLPAGDRSKIGRPLAALAGPELAGHELAEPELAGPELARPEEWVEIAAGSFMLGAGPEGFSYDNERPRHAVELGSFAIARRPVSNASWLRFSEGGGYERREWWSDEGWAWKQEHDITHHPAVATGQAQAPVCHVSWFEADAFARAHDARLPTEAEWERAATSNQQGPAGIGAASSQPSLVGIGATSSQQDLVGIGAVWEWTQSCFHGYPGFEAYPYREYSEVFFGERYRVLRGSSWATHPRVASRTFRNWDLPQRRQIFAGVRLARDV
ncbi:MAG TPA: SUMF1/EgtB/PvdO family nonheme iron enzyme [Solirubrobacteraceae bacterium]|jgi:iron(II)-dependent oxidoreductase